MKIIRIATFIDENPRFEGESDKDYLARLQKSWNLWLEKYNQSYKDYTQAKRKAEYAKRTITRCETILRQIKTEMNRLRSNVELADSEAFAD